MSESNPIDINSLHNIPAMDLGDNVIERWRAAQRIVAVCAAVVPCQMDLIAGTAPRDQARFINVVLFHLDPQEGAELAPRCR